MTRETDLALALEYSLGVLEPLEPPDSRFMSSEFVSAAAILCDCANEECRTILQNAIEARRAATDSESAPKGEV